MPRNAEVTRQWKILRTLEASRHGESVAALARQCGVTQRTIWRDVAALQGAGFPLVDEKTDGRTRWKLMPRGLKGLDNSGLTMSELASLYFSRALVQCLVGTPFQEDARSAMDKVAAALPRRMRAFLDSLPAVLDHHQVKMQYYSASSKETKEYLIEPYRLAYAQGGMYLLAHVPKIRQIRTFAIERIKSLSMTTETFKAPEGAPAEPFAHSLGVNTGPPEKIEIEFLPEAAVHIRERSWHPSQQVREKADGSIRLTLNVCNDWALRSWILSFGPLARVVSPSGLAEAILEQLEDARDGYVPHLDFGFSDAILDYGRNPSCRSDEWKERGSGPGAEQRSANEDSMKSLIASPGRPRRGLESSSHGGSMVLTKTELVAALHKEVRILLHLAGKLDIAQLDYRPTSKQRSAIELLRYLSFMGPALVSTAKNGKFDADAWKAEVAAADNRNLDETLGVIASLPDAYDRLLSDMSDADFRAEMTGFDGAKASKGAFIVSLVLGGHAAYRTQLFLYLKSCGQEHLGTVNLWRGTDAVPA